MSRFPFSKARPDKYPAGAVLFTDALVREICDNLGLSPALKAAVIEKLDPWEGESNALVSQTGMPSNLCDNRDEAVRTVVDALYNLHR